MADLSFSTVAKSFDYGNSQMIGVKLKDDKEITGIIYSIYDDRDTLADMLLEMSSNIRAGKIGKLIISKIAIENHQELAKRIS